MLLGWKQSITTAAWSLKWFHWLASSAHAALVRPVKLCSLQYMLPFLCSSFCRAVASIFSKSCYFFCRESTTRSQNEVVAQVIINHKIWSPKTMPSSIFILDAFNFLSLFAFKGKNMSRLLGLFLSKAAWILPISYLSLAAICELFPYQIL